MHHPRANLSPWNYVETEFEVMWEDECCPPGVRSVYNFGNTVWCMAGVKDRFDGCDTKHNIYPSLVLNIIKGC